MPLPLESEGGVDRDVASLWDMLRAAEAVAEFTSGISLEQFREQRIVQRAVERELEIIGEAARRVSEARRTEHADIPWRSIVGLRNYISHAYDSVDEERIWRLALDDVPPLIAQLRRIVPALPDSPPEPLSRGT